MPPGINATNNQGPTPITRTGNNDPRVNPGRGTGQSLSERLESLRKGYLRSCGIIGPITTPWDPKYPFESSSSLPASRSESSVSLDKGLGSSSSSRPESPVSLDEGFGSSLSSLSESPVSSWGSLFASTETLLTSSTSSGNALNRLGTNSAGILSTLGSLSQSSLIASIGLRESTEVDESLYVGGQNPKGDSDHIYSDPQWFRNPIINDGVKLILPENEKMRFVIRNIDGDRLTLEPLFGPEKLWVLNAKTGDVATGSGRKLKINPQLDIQVIPQENPYDTVQSSSRTQGNASQALEQLLNGKFKGSKALQERVSALMERTPTKDFARNILNRLMTLVCPNPLHPELPHPKSIEKDLINLVDQVNWLYARFSRNIEYFQLNESSVVSLVKNYDPVEQYNHLKMGVWDSLKSLCGVKPPKKVFVS